MKINAIYLSNRKKSSMNIELLVVCSVTIFAIVTGSLVSFYSDVGDEIKNILLNHITESLNKNVINIFMMYFSQNAIYLIITFIFGSSLYGKIPTLFLAFSKISGISSIVSILIRAYALKGLEYCLLVFFPGKIFFIFTIILSSVNSLKAAEMINRVNKKDVSAEFNSNLYIKQFAVSGIILFASALTDTLTLKLFLPLFDFN